MTDETVAAALASVETDLHTAEPVAAQVAAAPPAPNVAAINAVVDAWVVANLYNSPASRDTAIFNHIAAALPDLKARLAALL